MAFFPTCAQHLIYNNLNQTKKTSTQYLRYYWNIMKLMFLHFS